MKKHLAEASNGKRGPALPKKCAGIPVRSTAGHAAGSARMHPYCQRTCPHSKGRNQARCEQRLLTFHCAAVVFPSENLGKHQSWISSCISSTSSSFLSMRTAYTCIDVISIYRTVLLMPSSSNVIIMISPRDGSTPLTASCLQSSTMLARALRKLSTFLTG